MAGFAEQYETIVLRQQGNRLYLTLNRPQARNALNPAMIEELGSVFAALPARADVKCVVLRGAGGNFCAGADLKRLGELKPMRPGEADPLAIDNRRFGALLESIVATPQVVVAAIEGYALAGGLGLACAADIVVLRDDAMFGITEVALGLVPAQMSPFVALRIGEPQARRLALTAARFGADEALRLGLGHFLGAGAAGMEAKLEEVLKQIDRGGPLALAATKALFNEIARKPLPEALDFAARTLAQTLRGPEAPEGLKAFAEKRRPEWAA
ncbi:MAG: enoyl-CoA hydratase/isomerase family protein [Reyranellaceae bacterium]